MFKFMFFYCCCSLISITGVLAATSEPVLVFELGGIEEKEYKENALAFLDIDNEAGKPINNGPYIEYLAEVGSEAIKQSLRPFGYYRSRVELTLTKTPQQWLIRYNVAKGPPVRVKTIDITFEGAGKSDEKFTALAGAFPLKSGDILNQEKYTSFKGTILSQALAKGYFDGEFTHKQIVLSDDLSSADITIVYNTGSRYAFGKTTIVQNFLDDDVLKRYVQYGEGDVYTSDDIANLQRDLYNSGYVKTIDVNTAPDAADKTVPVTLAITPKKNKKHTFMLGYSTDIGARIGYDFDWRWVNRRGHSFKSSILASQKLLKMSAQYIIPADNPATDYYKLFVEMKRNTSGDIRSTTANIGGAYRDTNGYLTREIGVKWLQEDFSVGNDGGNIGLLTPYITLTYQKADNIINTSDGVFAKVQLTGASDAIASDVSFFQATAKAKYIKRIGEVNKITVAGAVGATWTDDFHMLPTHYRFFTGGDKTVRGYGYNSIGERDSSGSNIGGDKMYYVSGEYEYFFKEDMALAAFVDAGDAFTAGPSEVKVGAGIGYHYYSPIGPVQIDIAHGFDEPGDNVRVHFSVGPEL